MTATSRYPRYRQTGLPWLPLAPEHWWQKPIWSLYRRIKDTGHPDETMLSVFRDFGVVEKASRANLNVTAENRDIYQLIHPGWLAANRMKAWQGSVGVSALRGIVSGHYLCFAPVHTESDAFLNWLLRSDAYTAAYWIISRGVRVGQAEIDNDWYRLLPVLLPPLDEQDAIADYLDRETARIDALIEKQERLIETLRERRLSVSERIITKGLEPGIVMRSSGLRWAGEMPAHWKVGNVRRFAQMRTGHTPSRSASSYWEDCTIPWFTLADVWQIRDGKSTYVFAETETKISDLGLANSAAELLPAETVMLSRTASVGFAGIMPVPMATSQDYWNWVCGPDLLPKYLVAVFQAMRREFKALMIGSTHKTIYQHTAAALCIVVPPLDEQRRIVDHLDEQTGKIDTLIAKAERFIELAKERRAALITAAVTGQIDVRSHAV